MKRAGKGSIWELRVNDDYVCAGTQEQIAEYVGMSVKDLRNRIHQSETGYRPNMIFELILLKDSRPTYKMILENGKEIKGTIKELSEKSHFSYSYLVNVASGRRGVRQFKLEEVE